MTFLKVIPELRKKIHCKRVSQSALSNKTAFCIFWIMSKTWCPKEKKNPIIFQSAYPYLLSIRILSWFGLRRWKVGKKGEIFHVHHYMTLGTNYCCRIFWTHFLSVPQTRKKAKSSFFFLKRFIIFLKGVHSMYLWHS